MALTLAPVSAEDAGDPYEDVRNDDGTVEDPEHGQCWDYTTYVPGHAEDESSPVYVAWDGMHPTVLIPLWIYAESNGEEGLQRYDGYCTNEGADNVDAYRDAHDLIVF